LDPVTVGTDFYFQNALLGHICSHPFIVAYRGLSIYDAIEIMISNRIRKLPILNSTHDEIIGIVTTTDLAMFLSPSKRPGLVFSLLQALSRGRKERLKHQTKHQLRQKQHALEEIPSSLDSLKYYICRTCFKKFNNIERMGEHVLAEHCQKGEIV
jgi:CBS-domain-containing membrane protein